MTKQWCCIIHNNTVYSFSCFLPIFLFVPIKDWKNNIWWHFLRERRDWFCQFGYYTTISTSDITGRLKKTQHRLNMYNLKIGNSKVKVWNSVNLNTMPQIEYSTPDHICQRTCALKIVCEFLKPMSIRLMQKHKWTWSLDVNLIPKISHYAQENIQNLKSSPLLVPSILNFNK